jgi:2-polyprenyl-3-methyl-5-hydroxy-6-metoxy-1,4-benzoquinol methylase
MIHSCVVAPAHAAPTHAFVKRGIDIYTCPTCGCIMGDLAFDARQYESSQYYTLDFPDQARVELEWGFRWRHVLATLRRYVSAPRILDVGAGNGYFVFLARSECGWQADGLEISDAEAAYAREKFGLEFLRGDLDAVTGQYDVVTAFNVVEHVTDARALISSMKARLTPNGHLLLTTPNPACIHRRLRGLQKWRMVDPPHHINLFTWRALVELLTLTGLEVRHYETLSTYIRFVRNFDTRGLLLRRAAFHALKSANLGADHFVVCRAL